MAKLLKSLIIERFVALAEDAFSLRVRYVTDYPFDVSEAMWHGWKMLLMWVMTNEKKMLKEMGLQEGGAAFACLRHVLSH
jgi:hypothetical protein